MANLFRLVADAMDQGQTLALATLVRAEGSTPREAGTRMVVYPNEGHGIRQPRHREDVLRRTLAWFEKHGPK